MLINHGTHDQEEDLPKMTRYFLRCPGERESENMICLDHQLQCK